jgi:hypothetical protein
VRFETEADLVGCPGVVIGKEKNWLNVPAGIASLPGYRPMGGGTATGAQES